MTLFNKQKIRGYFGKPLQMLGYKTGLMKLTSRLQKYEGAIILMYHSVADNTKSKWIDPQNHIAADIFAEQMDFLAKNRNVIPLDELLSIVKQQKNPPSGTVAITFDDGYLDNLDVAAPILERYNFIATLFLPTKYIDRGETQWIDQVYSAFKFRTNKILEWGLASIVRYNLNQTNQFEMAYKAVCKDLIIANPEKRHELLEDLKNQLTPDKLPPRLTMTWDDIKTLQKDYKCFQFGGHTLEHTDLTNVSEEVAVNELLSCASEIKKEINIYPENISFCYGRTSENLRRITAEAGFKSACGGEGTGPLVHSRTNIFRLPRVPAPISMKKFDLVTSSYNNGFWKKIGR